MKAKASKGASHRVIAKRPPGPQHQLASPTRQPKLVPTFNGAGSKSKSFISGE